MAAQIELEVRMKTLEHRQLAHYASRGTPNIFFGNQSREYNEDPCMCVNSSFVLKRRDLAIQHVKSVLFNVSDIVNIDALSNVPKICFVSFSTPDGMRDFIHHQKSNAHFGRDKMWAPPNKSPHDRKSRTILGIIKRGICEHLKRSSNSMIIDGPSKSINAVEGGGRKKVASVMANYNIK